MQIAGIKLANKSLVLSQTSGTASMTTKVINNENIQTINNMVFLKENYNNIKHATLKPF